MGSHAAGFSGGAATGRIDARRVNRVGSDLPVELHVAELHGALLARSRDVGVGGLCVATPSAFDLKAVRRVVIGLPSGPLTLEAEGRWQIESSSDDLVLSGLSFTSVSPETIELLSNVVLESALELSRFLYSHSQLREFGLDEVLGLAQITRFRDVGAGRTIYRQDTAKPGEDSIFFVGRGGVCLQARVRGAREVTLARLRPGDGFGGMPLVGDSMHPESAVAESDCRLLEINREAYRYLDKARPWLAKNLAFLVVRTYSKRLQEILVRVRDQLE